MIILHLELYDIQTKIQFVEVQEKRRRFFKSCNINAMNDLITLRRTHEIKTMPKSYFEEYEKANGKSINVYPQIEFAQLKKRKYEVIIEQNNYIPISEIIYSIYDDRNFVSTEFVIEEFYNRMVNLMKIPFTIKILQGKRRGKSIVQTLLNDRKILFNIIKNVDDPLYVRNNKKINLNKYRMDHFNKCDMFLINFKW